MHYCVIASSQVKVVLRKSKDKQSFAPTGEEAQPTSESPKLEAFVTDNGNFILDLFLERPIPDKHAAANELRNMVGVIEHGLFLNMASAVIVATSEGIVVHKK